MYGFDWLSASEAARVQLYKAIKRETDLQSMTLADFLNEVLGLQKVSPSYDSNLRSGRYARKHAVLFFRWLDQINHEAAEDLIDSVLALEDSAGAWSRVAAKLEDASPIDIVPVSRSSLGVVGFARTPPITKIDRGTAFILRMNMPSHGHAIGLQQFSKKWFNLPLNREGRPAHVPAGQVELPRLETDGAADPLCEETDAGLFQFVVVFSKMEQTFLPLTGSEFSGEPIASSLLDAFAGEINLDPSIHLFAARLLVT